MAMDFKYVRIQGKELARIKNPSSAGLKQKTLTK